MTLRQAMLAEEGKYEQLREERRSYYKQLADGVTPSDAESILKAIEANKKLCSKVEYALEILAMVDGKEV